MLHPSKEGRFSPDLSFLAKVNRAEAQRAALASIKAPPAAAVDEGEIEIEQGCLVYSFDIRVPGKSGIDEVIVDAGTGKTLSHTHETARQEAVERTQDQVVPRKRR